MPRNPTAIPPLGIQRKTVHFLPGLYPRWRGGGKANLSSGMAFAPADENDTLATLVRTSGSHRSQGGLGFHRYAHQMAFPSCIRAIRVIRGLNPIFLGAVRITFFVFSRFAHRGLSARTCGVVKWRAIWWERWKAMRVLARLRGARVADSRRKTPPPCPPFLRHWSLQFLVNTVSKGVCKGLLHRR